MKKILVTGSRSGIALEVIKSIIDRDYYIYATTHTEKEAKRLEELFVDYDNIECFKMDVTDDNDLKQVDNLDIDILLSNAAIANGGNLIELEIDRLRENFEVNVFGNLKLIQKIIKKKINSTCRIIIMSSLAGIIPIKFIGAYASTKACLIKIGQILNKEIHMINPNIDVVIIEPGLFLTGFNRYLFMNKYDNNNSIFNEYEGLINLEENLLLNLIGQKDLDKITNQIVKAIKSDNPKLIYRAPYSQVIGAKLYCLFKE